MKQRIGVISCAKEAFVDVKPVFPDAHFHLAANVLDFYQIIRTQKPNLVIFHAFDLPMPPPETDLTASINYLRKKPEFQRTPFMILHYKPEFSLPYPMKDPLLRAFQAGDNLFLRTLDFVVKCQNPESLEDSFQIADNVVEEAFTSALSKRMGLSTQFSINEATDDEAHASFFCQKSNEISTTRFWVRYTARILEEGNPAFVAMFKNFSEQEREEMSNRLLDMVMADFTGKLEELVKKDGGLPFPPSDKLEFEHRRPFIKTAINKSQVFRSDVCCLLLETTRYI